MNASESGTQPTTIVIFGASGDLTKRKLIPALFNLHRKDKLPQKLKIFGFARSPFTHESFREHLKKALEEFSGYDGDAESWKGFADGIWYCQGDITGPDDYKKIGSMLAEFESGPSNRIYYAATGPDLYAGIVGALGSSGLADEIGGWRRVVIEKPFGRDLASAQDLNRSIHKVFDERQVYRIDHYLGKETAQNILFFRFGNTIFEPIWNRNYVDSVQITVAENVNVEHRADYYDKMGVLRDMFQNHLLQLLALMAMEPPASFDADEIRNEKAKVFSALRPIRPAEISKHTVSAQYRGYREASGVDAASRTPTYAAVRAQIDNWRWQGVPFFLRSGKALAVKVSEIVIQFRCPPHVMFHLPQGKSLRPNMLVLSIQPDEGMDLRFQIKVPGALSETRSVVMAFDYADEFGLSGIPDAYERLLLDVIVGDASLFTRSDGIEACWRFIDPIVNAWADTSAPAPALYEEDTWGPVEADDFIVGFGRKWYISKKYSGG